MRPAETSVEGYFWPPGFFHRFGSLNQSQKEIMLWEVEKKLASLRESDKGLVVRGELMNKLRIDVMEYNTALILDQTGLIVMVRKFPNLYYGFTGPEVFLNRNTFLVINNPRVDRVESILRQGIVVSGDFFAFSQLYLETTLEGLHKAITGQAGLWPVPPGGQTPRGKPGKKP